MNIVVFGLSISSAWGNGHATLLRGLFRALHQQGHSVTFFEKDVPYYAAHRDASEFRFATLCLYRDFCDVIPYARKLLANADAAIVTSYCPDGRTASDVVLNSKSPCKVFYDMDTPVTLLHLDRGEQVPYLPETGLGDFDLVLSYTGGQALTRLQRTLSARRVATLYGWVDPLVYQPFEPVDVYRCDLSYLGTYAADRQRALEQLFLKPASSLPEHKFVIGGAMYPDTQSWPTNVRYFDHVSPDEHCSFYCSAPLTLNITRGSMAAMGYCPSGRLFEAAACGTAVISDDWLGLDEFFQPGIEILTVSSTQDVLEVLTRNPEDLRLIGQRARKRALESHTADLRARRLISLLQTPDSEESNLPEIAIQQGAR